MTFPLKPEHLAAAGVTEPRISTFLAPLNAAMQEFGIVVSERPAMFLAQVSEESGGFRYMAELWGPTPQQLKYDDGGPLAQKLGNGPGSGFLYRGHGLIQITGCYNHLKEARYFGIPPADIIAWLQTPVGACRSAGHYWADHGCNPLADDFDFVTVTLHINGGLTHLAQRTALYKAITDAMS